MNYSHAERLLEKDAWIIVLIRGVDEDDEQQYHYLAVRGAKLDEFLEVQKSGEFFDPENYGVIVESGEGDPPPPSVQKKIMETFSLSQVN